MLSQRNRRRGVSISSDASLPPEVRPVAGIASGVQASRHGDNQLPGTKLPSTKLPKTKLPHSR
jgi:hypothetical protein